MITLTLATLLIFAGIVIAVQWFVIGELKVELQATGDRLTSQRSRADELQRRRNLWQRRAADLMDSDLMIDELIEVEPVPCSCSSDLHERVAAHETGLVPGVDTRGRWER